MIMAVRDRAWGTPDAHGSREDTSCHSTSGYMFHVKHVTIESTADPQGQENGFQLDGSPMFHVKHSDRTVPFARASDGKLPVAGESYTAKIAGKLTNFYLQRTDRTSG
jgi:hypothetical protein